MTITPKSFEVHPSSGLPIYQQVINQIDALMVGGQLKTGDMLPSVRQMAQELGVNMMTISKAYSKLEADGVLDRARGRGMVIRARSISGSLPERIAEVRPLVEHLVVRGMQLGLTEKQVQDLVTKVQREKTR